MKYYFFSAALIIVAILFVAILPAVTTTAQDLLTVYEVPKNNSEVAGVQKYNIPPVAGNIPAPLLSAKSILVKDLTTGTPLYYKDPQTRLPIASTTKIMTALVASEYFDQNSPLVVGDSSTIGGATVGLKKGETLSFRSLLYGMLLNSGNDAAYAIAENYPGGVIGFVSAMNKKAAVLGLQNTHFENPAGFDNVNNFSSASDLSKITEEAINNPNLAKIFATKETEVISLDKKYKHELKNLNKLLTQVTGVMGVKTGYTDLAKENLVTLIDREGRRVLIVILGSDDRFGETTNLISWTYSNFNWSGFDQ